MAEKIKLVQGDTRPQIKCVLTDEQDGSIINLAGATVRMRFRAVGSDVVLTTLVGNLLTGQELDDGSINYAEPYDAAGRGGRVVFVWGANDLNVDAGDYEGEIEITFPDATTQTVYDTLKFKLRADF